jgi:hypothetical protein
MWLAAPPDTPARSVQALLTALRESLTSIRPLALDYPARQHEQAIRSSGFIPTQTLIWMELGLDKG